MSAATGSHRKWHTKSRKGCHSCKTRKIKCDEQHPSCRNCIKRGIQCDFLQSEDTPTPVSVPANLDLELLHHFTISTASTLSTETQVRDLWRVVVPQIGFSVPYILNGVLALSALHMARYNPARREVLLSQAGRYHAASLEEALPLIPSVTSENCTHLFLFGVLTLFFNLASPRKADDILLVGNRAVPEWLYLLRGIGTLVAADSAIFSSPVSLIFKAINPGQFWPSHPPEKQEFLDELETRIGVKTSDSAEKQASLLQAVQALRWSYDLMSSKDSNEHTRLRKFYAWLFAIEESYLKLLKHADSEALCVLAFFCVLMREFERYWWIEGWAVHILRQIYILLDDEYRLWIRWPIEEMGWVPETAPR
ncbi:hypothetical protein BKA56DRAFT_620719 [Ilyonectria sp. MPI-CAGE-AT-0026]|nr:hypothetical protein BKA56DRAFT_620719 [Ilyonectria sp. MPI-CAGE-AT-0026]